MITDISRDKDFISLLEQKVKDAERIITGYLPEEAGYGKKVIEAMNYSVTAGGKRLRPIMLGESYLVFAREEHTAATKLVHAFMAAIEMIHSYSLVHDDLPALDNDEYRRGRKTTHAVYGAGMATIAGDALLNYAFETIIGALRITAGRDNGLTAKGIEAFDILSSKAGIYGMIGGQSADLEAEGAGMIPGDQLIYIHENKTSALIEAALMCGAILAGADIHEISDMEKAGRLTGLAFQIRDDILDVEGDETKLGKPLHSDEKNGKCTYVSLYGLERAKLDCEGFSEEAAGLVSKYAGTDGFLTGLIQYLTRRES